MSTKIKKHVIAIMIATFVLSSIPYQLSFGMSGMIFEESAYNICHKTVHIYNVREVRSCATGQIIRIEPVSQTDIQVTYSSEYCNGGWGFCMFADGSCGPEDEYQQHTVEWTCE